MGVSQAVCPVWGGTSLLQATLCPQPWETHRHQRKSRPTWAGIEVHTVPAAESLTLAHVRLIPLVPQLTLLKMKDDNNYLTVIHGDKRSISAGSS